MTNDKIQMTSEIQMSNDKMDFKYDLEKRTLMFAKNCIDLCKLIYVDSINVQLVDQLVRASCSVGANYREANEASTTKDFFYRIGICRKEAKETKYWLELLLHSNIVLSDSVNSLIDEAHQLVKIFACIHMRKI